MRTAKLLVYIHMGASGQDKTIDPFIGKVRDFIAGNNLLPRGAGVLAAVSGGADSVAMLAALAELAGEFSWQVTVAHLNHLIRPTAGEDADFVAALAGRMGLAFVGGRADVPALARASGQSLELAARNARYEFLARTAREAGAGFVATGHHADDNVETVLFRLVRGTHLRGLGGIRPSRPLDATGVALVRPLLACRRAEIEAFCRSRGLSWRTDETNAELHMVRNRVRHELLPAARRVSPSADEAILRLAQAAADAEQTLEALGKEALAEAIAQASQREGKRRRTPGELLAAHLAAAEAFVEDEDSAGDDAKISQAARLPLRLSAKSLAKCLPLVREYALRLALELVGAPMGDVTARHIKELSELASSAVPRATRPVGTKLHALHDSAGVCVNLPGNLEARAKAGCIVFGRAGSE